MTSASVGFHCPECSKSGAQKVIRGTDLSSKPVFSYAILALIVAIFFIQQASRNGAFGPNNQFTSDFVLWGPGVSRGEWWRIVTSGFLHQDFIHIGFNGYLIYRLGPILEKMVGPVRTALVYFGGLFGGSAAVLAFNFSTGALGASGAVLGLAGGVAALFVLQGRPIGEVPFVGLVGLNLALPLILPGISFWGHFGGVVGGFAVSYLIGTAMRRARPSRATEHSPVVQGGPDQSVLVGSGAMIALAALAGTIGVVGGIDLPF